MKARIIIYGTGKTANYFLENSCNIIVMGISDSYKCGGAFHGYPVKAFEEWRYEDADRIVICSNMHDEILCILEKYHVKSKVSVFAFDNPYYKDCRSFQDDPLYNMLNHSAKKLMKKNIQRIEFERKLQEVIKNSCLEKGIEQDYPNSVYLDTFTNEELMTTDLLSAFLDLQHFEVIMRNCFGYRHYIDRGLISSLIAKYNFTSDCYPILRFLKKFIKNVECSFDIGANRGMVSMFLSGMSDKVYAFEPSEEVSDIALRNISLNNINNIIWNKCGVGSNCEKHIYYDCGVPSSGHNSFMRQKDDVVLYESYVDVVSMDEYCDSHSIDHVDVVKIDVEGYESEVLAGAANLINDNRIGMIIFEVSPLLSSDRDKFDKMIAKLFQRNFKFYDLHLKQLKADDILQLKSHLDVVAILDEGLIKNK